MGVVYLLTFGYSSFYVGKKCRILWQRIRDHINDINGGNLESPTARHFASNHDYSAKSLQFLVLTKIHPHFRGGDFHKQILQVETK